MKYFSFLTVLMLAGFTAVAQNPKVINDANAQKRTVTSFHGIAIQSGIDLYLNQGGDEAVAVSASDRDVRDRIVTEVEDGILHIYLDDKWHWGWGEQETEGVCLVQGAGSADGFGWLGCVHR